MGGREPPLSSWFGYVVMTKLIASSCSHPRVPQLFYLCAIERNALRVPASVPALIRVRRWPAWQARHRLSGALHAARPQGLRDGWRGGLYRYRSEGSAVRRARGFLRPPRGERVICSPAATYFSMTSVQHVGENAITQRTVSEP